MKTVDKAGLSELKKHNDEHYGGFYKAQFDVPVYVTDNSTGEEFTRSERMNGFVLKDKDSEKELFVGYDQYNDGWPKWHCFEKEELANDNFKIGVKTTLEEEEAQKPSFKGPSTRRRSGP